MSTVKVLHGYKTTIYDTGGIETMGNITAARNLYPKLTSLQTEILYMIYKGWCWHEITRLLGMTDDQLAAELLAFNYKEIESLEAREAENWQRYEQIQKDWA